jgi:hypothetical protein
MEIIRNIQKYVNQCILLIDFALIYIIACFIGVLQRIEIAYFRPLRGHKYRYNRLIISGIFFAHTVSYTLN